MNFAKTQPEFTLLFDLDGTLIDSVRLILNSFHHTYRVHRDGELSDEHWQKLIGRSLVDIFGEMSTYPGEVLEMITTYRQHNHAAHDQMISPYDGVVDAIAELSTRGHKLGIVTSKATMIAQRGLDLCGLADFFEVMVSCDDVKQHKPHPAPVLHAMSLLKTSPQQTVFIGDSPADIESGNAAGVTTYGVNWGAFAAEELRKHKPLEILSSPQQFLELTL